MYFPTSPKLPPLQVGDGSPCQVTASPWHVLLQRPWTKSDIYCTISRRNLLSLVSKAAFGVTIKIASHCFRTENANEISPNQPPARACVCAGFTHTQTNTNLLVSVSCSGVSDGRHSDEQNFSTPPGSGSLYMVEMSSDRQSERAQ